MHKKEIKLAIKLWKITNTLNESWVLYQLLQISWYTLTMIDLQQLLIQLRQ